MNMTRLDLIDVDALLSLENYFDNNPQIYCPFAQCTNIAYECYGYTAFNPSWFCMKRDVFNTIITQGYFSYNSPMGGAPVGHINSHTWYIIIYLIILL